MKKLLLSAAVASAMATGANAAIVDNDINQFNALSLQFNGVIDASLVSVGNTVVVGSNLVNTASFTGVAATASLDNDINQGAIAILQGNGVISLNGIDIGDTTVTGLNSVNSAEMSTGAVGILSVTAGNDINQGAFLVAQGNGVVNGAVLSAGSITVDGTNLVNTATQTVGGVGALELVIDNDINQSAAFIAQGNGVLNAAFGSAGNIDVTGVNAVNTASQTVLDLGLLSGVIDNDIDQEAFGIAQGNGVIDAQIVGVGNVTVDGTNLVNTASQNIGSAGIIINGVIDNDIDQDADTISQTNGVFDAALLNIGNVSVTGVNSVNSAERNVAAAGIIDVVAGNDIDQDAVNITQSNTVTSLSGLGLGNISVTGTNLVNTASGSYVTLAGADGVVGNAIDQDFDNIRQDNEILVGAVLRGGDLTVTGLNSANSASNVIDSNSAVVALVAENDITQTGTDIVQANRVGVVAGATVGSVLVDGTNLINTASMDITFNTPGLAIGNDVTQTMVGATQYNAVGILAGAQAGPITVNGTNAINTATVSIIQTP